MTRAYAQLYDYAVIVSLKKSSDGSSSAFEPCVKFKFPPQVREISFNEVLLFPTCIVGSRAQSE